jgi:hypothetical protein
MKTAWLHRGQAWPPALPNRCINLTVGSLDELADMVEASL